MKIKSLSIVLMLISGTLLSMGPFVQESLGQVEEEDGDGSPQERLDILLQILNNASQHVSNRIIELQENNVTISEEAIERFENGLVLAQDAILKNSTGDFEGAIEDALDAMENFRKSLKEAEESAEDTDIDDTEDEAEDALAIAAKIQRTKNLRDKLEDLLERRAEQGHNVSGLRIAIANANDRIFRSESLLEEGNLDESEDQLEDVSEDLEDIQKNKHNEIAKSEKPDKVEKFLSKATSRIEKLVEQFEELRIPEDVRQNILESLNNSLTRIKEARGLNNTDDSIENIKDGLDDEDEALDEAERRVPEFGKPLKAIAELERVIDHFEGKLARTINHLEKYNITVDISEIQIKITNAKSLLENASQEIGNNTVLAETLKNLVEDLKDEIEDDIEDLEELIEEKQKSARENQNVIFGFEKIFDNLDRKLMKIIDALQRNNITADVSSIQTKILEARSMLENSSDSILQDPRLIKNLKDLVEDLKDEIEDDIDELEDLIEDKNENEEKDDDFEKRNNDNKRNPAANQKANNRKYNDNNRNIKSTLSISNNDSS